MAPGALRSARLAVLQIILSGGVAAIVLQHHTIGGAERASYENGVAAAEQGNVAEASIDFERAIRLNPRYADAYEMLSATYLALDANDEQESQDIKDASAFDRPLRSAARLKELIAQRPEDPNLHLQLARQYESLDAPADALNQYEELLRLNSYETVARSRIEALSARSVPNPEIEWAWRVLATETGLRFPSAQ